MATPRIEFDVVALLDARPIGGGSGHDMPGRHAVGGIHPGDAVVGTNERERCWKFRTAKMIAATVSRARITAPSRIRRLSFIRQSTRDAIQCVLC